MPQRVAVLGGRHYADRVHVAHVLRAAWRKYPGSTLIESGALGAERLAREWASGVAVPVETAPLRYTQDVCLVLVFPGGRRTADLVAVAAARGLNIRYASVVGSQG